MTNIMEDVLTALVVDDEPAIRNMLGELLSEEGFATATCGAGLPALAALGERRFDVLVVDIGLPDISGFRICEEARSRYLDFIHFLARG